MAIPVWFVEIIDAIVVVLVLGFIMMKLFERFVIKSDKSKKEIKKKLFILGILVAGPAVLLHELGHKIAAMIFGMNATLHAAYGFLAIGVILVLINSPVIFFVPAFVAISPKPGIVAPTLAIPIIAFAGPFINLVLWISADRILKYGQKNKIKKITKHTPFFILTSKINMLLFIFNLLPIPGFDGYHVITGIIAAL